MKISMFSAAYPRLFKNIGEPTIRSANRLRAMQKKCAGRNNPNAFYVAVDPRPDPKLVWSHNTVAHFGMKALSYKNFMSAVHPFWRPLYQGMAEFSYQSNQAITSEKTLKELILTSNVPLRNNRGQYFWYSQISFAGSFDARGAMVEYLNEYHRLAEFNRMIPAAPSLTYRGKLVEEFDERVKAYTGTILDASLRELLSPACYKLLLAYRIIAFKKGRARREEVAKFLRLSLQALDKGNSRLLSQAALAFPASTLTSVAGLASFLNEFFGSPVQQTARA